MFQSFHQLQETCENGKKTWKIISLEEFSLVIVMHLKIEMTWALYKATNTLCL
jgi:hypothetical protein